MEKKDEAHPEEPELSPQQQTRVLLDLIYSVKTLAGNVDVMHRDLRRIRDEDANFQARELDRLKEIVNKTSQHVQIMPIQIAGHLDRLMEKKVDDVLDDVRLSISDLGNKLSRYTNVRETQAALPAPMVTDDISDVTSRLEFKKDAFHFHLKTAGIEKVWKIVRWIVAAVAAGGGGWALVKNLFGL